MKSIWTGAIGFGLVNIPVKLFSATAKSELDLDMLDKKDHAHIHFHRVNEETGKEVKLTDIVKGYKYQGNYVILDDDDFEQASPKKSKVIEIINFISEDEVDPIYYEMPYYLEPEKSGARAYALLREALVKSKRSALGNFVLRNREHLCVLTPYKKAIVLNRIRFAEEIKSPSDLSLPETGKPKPGELKMAMSLVDQLTSKFDISAYKDTYSDELLKLVKAKAKGKAIKQPAVLKVTHRKTDDLMSQLKASLKKAS
jgi:DNA end-binding protein Ku